MEPNTAFKDAILNLMKGVIEAGTLTIHEGLSPGVDVSPGETFATFTGLNMGSPETDALGKRVITLQTPISVVAIATGTAGFGRLTSGSDIMDYKGVEIEEGDPIDLTLTNRNMIEGIDQELSNFTYGVENIQEPPYP